MHAETYTTPAPHRDLTKAPSVASEPTQASTQPMRKIIVMVGVAIFVFLAFTTYSVQKSIQTSQKQAAIKDLYFPVLERVDANIVRLDKMEERFLQAVMTGERDPIDEAANLYAAGDKAFEDMLERYPQRAQDIAKLRAEFQHYNAFAATTSAALMAQKGGDAKGMNLALSDLRQHIKAFRESSYANFLQTLEESQAAVKFNLYMGIALGLMNLAFMAVLVFFIRNNVRMMTVIAEQNATLENRVAERTAQLSQKTSDINAMLHNMSLGVCTVVPGNTLHPEYSSHMHSIFGSDSLDGQDVLERLFAISNLGVDAKDQVATALGSIIGEDNMMFDCNGHLLVREMQIEGSDGRAKMLQMDWSPIVSDQDVVEKVLLIVQDVTHLRELELASAHQKEELDLISQILKISIGKFNDFLDNAKKLAADNRRVILQSPGRDPQAITALFRNMHTIKGNARTYEFRLITDAAHAAEQEYDRLRKDEEAAWSSEALLDELGAVEAAIARYQEVSEDKLGRKGRASDLLTTRGVFVSHDAIADLKALAATLEKSGTDLTALTKGLDRLGLIPLERIVSGSVDSIASLAKELEKPTPRAQLLGGDMALNSAFSEALKSALMHIVRNALDHGIESPLERIQAHKHAQGQLHFVCTRQGDDTAELQVFDDGRGLALHKLLQKGVACGMFAPHAQPTPEAIAELVFHSGLSTAEALTQVSGRGVGMDAARAFLTEQGGSIRVALNAATPGVDAQAIGFTPFKFVIELPPCAFTH